MPPSFVAKAQAYHDGVYSIAIAPNDSNVIYMMYPIISSSTERSAVYVSRNKGATWTSTNFTPLTTSTNAPANNANYRWWGQKMAVDPNDANTVYVGTQASGLFVSTDGGNSWSSVRGIPASTTSGITGIIVNPSNSKNVFAASGGNGIYETVSGVTGTWMKINDGSGPTAVEHAALDPGTGYYYVVDGSNNLWVWNGSTWSETIVNGGGSSKNAFGVAIDPYRSGHVIAIAYNGNLNETFNSGGTWSNWSDNSGTSSPSYVAADIVWMPILNTLLSNQLFFDRLTPGKLLEAGGNDFFYTTLSGNITSRTKITWNSQGNGIEQLVANEIVVPPVSGATPILASWDRAFFAPNL